MQRRVLEFAHALATSEPKGVPGASLLRFAGTISKEDLDLMEKAIEEDCEKVRTFGALQNLSRVLQCWGVMRRPPLNIGTIKLQLKQLGRPLPQNDIWIAAIAKQHHLTLATRDKHFQVVAGLLYENW